MFMPADRNPSGSKCSGCLHCDKDGSEIELKDDDDDDFIPDMKDEIYQSDDDEIESEGFSIEDVPEDELGADLDFGTDDNDSDFDSEEDM